MTIAITTTSLITGSSNTDGSGGAENLTVENGHEIDLEQGWVIDDPNPYDTDAHLTDGDTTITTSEDEAGNGLHDIDITIENTGEWNDDGQKELSVDTDDAAHYLNGAGSASITIENFVDVNLHATDTGSWTGVTYVIEGAKRGTIDFSDSTDKTNSNDLDIIAHSNGDHWDNTFEITGSENSDHFSISGDSSTQYTEFSVDLGAGRDTFSVDVAAANSSVTTRFVDGGEGFDTLTITGDIEELGIEFVNFERIHGSSGDSLATVTLNENVLTHNGSEDAPLIVENAAVEFTGDIESISATESDYGNNYYDVTVNYDDASYTVITDHIDQDWLV